MPPPPRKRARPPLGHAWPRYRANLARHLMGIDRAHQRALMEGLAAEGFAGLRLSFTPVLARLSTGPQPLGTLAADLDVSAQAMSQLVRAVESAGLTERHADPEDGRSRKIALTKRGEALLVAADRQMASALENYAERIGPAAAAALGEPLADALAALQKAPGSASSLADSEAREPQQVAGQASASLGALHALSVEIQRTLMLDTAAFGHRGLKLSHAHVLPLIGPEGARVGTLARIQGLTRQAVSATARDLEALGVLRREPDPTDRRGVVVQLTAAGEALIQDSVRALDQLDARLRSALGPARFDALCASAQALYESLQLESEIFGSRNEAASSLEGLAARLRAELGPAATQRLADLLRAPPTRHPAPSAS